MLAKSTRDASQGRLGRLEQPLRALVSLFTLCAALTALILIVRAEYGDSFQPGTLGSIMPLRSLQAAEQEEDGVTRAAPEREANRVDAPVRYRALAEFLAKRYRVSQDMTLNLVTIAHTAGHRLGLDPLLIIAVIAVESGFNPFAESVAGAKGLMQVIPKYHSEKLEAFGGEHTLFDPRTNILVGSQILKEYLRSTGSTEAALQRYAGIVNDAEDDYTGKVLSEKRRLQNVVRRTGHEAVRVADVTPVGR